MSLNHVKEYNREIREWLLSVFALAAAIPKDQLERRVCPVCGSSESTFFANNDYLDYEKCNRCTLIYMNPAPSAEMVAKGFQGEDELLMEYFAIMSKFRSNVRARPDPLTDNKLHDLYRVKQSGRLLDVGCSFGDFLHKAKYFYAVEGVEVNPYTASVAESEFVVHKNYLSELNLEKRYDIITLHQILYGVPDPVALFRDIHNIMADEGILYVNTPNADSYAMQLFKGKANHLYGYTSQNVFNRVSLEKLAGITGFRIRSFRTEWLDIYLTDLVLFLDQENDFIHKKNAHIYDYEEKVALEENMIGKLDLDLGNKGNYLVAVLEKV